MLCLSPDINECVNAGLRGETLCDPPMMCINKDGDDGKFECVCPPGTELMDSMCGKCNYVCFLRL